MVAPLPDGRIARSMVRVPGSGSNEDASSMVCLNLGNVSSFAGIVQVPQSLSLTMRNGRQQMMMSSLSPGATKHKPEPTSLLSDDAANSTRANQDASRATPVDVITSVMNNNGGQSATVGRTTPSTVVNGPRHKRPFRQESAEEPAVVPKRYKAMAAISTNLAVPSGTLGTTQSLSPLPLLLPVVTPSGTTMAVPITQGNNGQPSFFFPGTMSAANTRQPQVLVPGQVPVVGTCGVQQMVLERDQLMKENISLKRRLSLFHHLLRNKEKLSRVLRHLEAVSS